MTENIFRRNGYTPKGKKHSRVQALAPKGAVSLSLRDSLASKPPSQCFRVGATLMRDNFERFSLRYHSRHLLSLFLAQKKK